VQRPVLTFEVLIAGRELWNGMLPTRAALQEAARQEALEQERARMAAFLDDSAAVVQPAHAPWTVPCNLELEVQPRASFSEIEEELRHLELDLVEAIEGYKEHVHELHFWRSVLSFWVSCLRAFLCGRWLTHHGLLFLGHADLDHRKKFRPSAD